FLGGVAAARDGLLYFQPSVFKNRDIPVQDRGHGNTLRAPQLERHLHVSSVEESLQRLAVWLVLLNEHTYFLKDSLQFEVMVSQVAEFDDAKTDERKLLAGFLHDAITHYHRPWVDSENDALSAFRLYHTRQNYGFTAIPVRTSAVSER